MQQRIVVWVNEIFASALFFYTVLFVACSDSWWTCKCSKAIELIDVLGTSVLSHERVSMINCKNWHCSGGRAKLFLTNGTTCFLAHFQLYLRKLFQHPTFHQVIICSIHVSHGLEWFVGQIQVERVERMLSCFLQLLDVSRHGQTASVYQVPSGLCACSSHQWLCLARTRFLNFSSPTRMLTRNCRTTWSWSPCHRQILGSVGCGTIGSSSFACYHWEKPPGLKSRRWVLNNLPFADTLPWVWLPTWVALGMLLQLGLLVPAFQLFPRRIGLCSTTLCCLMAPQEGTASLEGPRKMRTSQHGTSFLRTTWVWRWTFKAMPQRLLKKAMMMSFWTAECKRLCSCQVMAMTMLRVTLANLLLPGCRAKRKRLLLMWISFNEFSVPGHDI